MHKRMSSPSMFFFYVWLTLTGRGWDAPNQHDRREPKKSKNDQRCWKWKRNLCNEMKWSVRVKALTTKRQKHTALFFISTRQEKNKKIKNKVIAFAVSFIVIVHYLWISCDQKAKSLTATTWKGKSKELQENRFRGDRWCDSVSVKSIPFTCSLLSLRLSARFGQQFFTRLRAFGQTQGEKKKRKF